MQHHQAGKIRKAFTLIEMLVVLLIIGLLAAILFPVVNGAKERAYQASCASNLHQIYLAVELYKNDEGGYPPNLAVLLPNTETLAGGSLNVNGKDYFRGGNDALVCADDDMESTDLRSSYGDVGNPNVADFGNYVWNYWGYRTVNDAKAPNLGSPVATCSDTNVSECLGTAYQTEADFQAMITSSNANENPFLINRYAISPSSGSATAPQTDPTQIDTTKLPMLANRFAKGNTIITHCVFHRLPMSSLAGNYDLYDTTNTDGQGAKDIILRLDGTAKVLDVSGTDFSQGFSSSNLQGDAWATQNF